MLVQSALLRVLAAAVLVLDIVASMAAKRIDSCDGVVPRTLQLAIKQHYPDLEVVTLAMLTKQAEKLYRKSSGQGCPGITKVDFFGDGSETYALVLTKKSGSSNKSSLMLATRKASQQWEFTVVEADVEDAPPVVLTKPPGEFADVYGDKTLRSDHEAILFVGYESWAIVYAWNGKAIDKVWLSD